VPTRWLTRLFAGETLVRPSFLDGNIAKL